MEETITATSYDLSSSSISPVSVLERCLQRKMTCLLIFLSEIPSGSAILGLDWHL